MTLSKIFSYGFIVVISSCLLLYGVGMWFSIKSGDSFISMVAATFFYLLWIVGMAIFAIYHLWRYPDITTSDKGMELKVFFYTRNIEWKDILRFQRSKNELCLFLKIKGLLLNRLYGLFDAKTWDQPMVLFVSSEHVVDKLEENIKLHLS